MNARHAKAAFLRIDGIIPRIDGIGKQYQSFIRRTELGDLLGMEIIEHTDNDLRPITLHYIETDGWNRLDDREIYDAIDDIIDRCRPVTA